MNQRITLITAFLILLSVCNCYAQNNFPILAMNVSVEPVGNYLTQDSLPAITDSTIFETQMGLELYDTLDIQNFEVKIGSAPGSSDVFSGTFQFDVSGSLGGGLSYVRDGYSVTLGLSQLTGMLSYYSQVRVLKANGSYSSAVVFNR